MRGGRPYHNGDGRALLVGPGRWGPPQQRPEFRGSRQVTPQDTSLHLPNAPSWPKPESQAEEVGDGNWHRTPTWVLLLWAAGDSQRHSEGQGSTPTPDRDGCTGNERKFLFAGNTTEVGLGQQRASGEQHGLKRFISFVTFLKLILA